MNTYETFLPSANQKLQNWQIDGQRVEPNRHGAYVVRHSPETETDNLPIVLIGGIGSNVNSLRSLGEALTADGHNVLRVDASRAPKIGQTALRMMSLWGEMEFADIAKYADVIADTLDDEAIEKAYIVGHSFGGIQAEMTALRYPNRVAGLGLFNTVGGAAVCPPTPEALMMVSKPDRDNVSEVARVYGGPFLENPNLVAELGINKPRDPETQRAYRLAQSTAVSSLMRVAPMIPRIPQPALVVTGEYDPLVPAPNASYLNFWLPNSTLRTIGGGHMDVVANPEPFAEAISDHYSCITDKSL